MILKDYVRRDEDALSCDFAEVYSIYDWRKLPGRYAATLAAGLRPGSRCCMKTNGVKVQLGESLEAMIHDDLSAILYVMTQRKKHGKKPEFISHDLIYGKKERKDNEYEGFDNPSDYEKKWTKITGEHHGEGE